MKWCESRWCEIKGKERGRLNCCHADIKSCPCSLSFDQLFAQGHYTGVRSEKNKDVALMAGAKKEKNKTKQRESGVKRCEAPGCCSFNQC